MRLWGEFEVVFLWYVKNSLWNLERTFRSNVRVNKSEKEKKFEVVREFLEKIWILEFLHDCELKLISSLVSLFYFTRSSWHPHSLHILLFFRKLKLNKGEQITPFLHEIVRNSKNVFHSSFSLYKTKSFSFFSKLKRNSSSTRASKSKRRRCRFLSWWGLSSVCMLFRKSK